ncbi:hypothetical protein KXD40_008579 [Peronospora effusa]|uniref:Uncharacterized protein n=1 Tax=Peronospora effusa TaxID=542832 RepID=A0A3M6VNT7_9STRA|nr:hypothetical protein DD238_002278 [Peronospora effusa]RQM17796.1 hypothetical protein DD237_001660 [Peronospora effusa]UIZ24276.1 hypothetical protein KXD40_008579 [Peronospora effusa]
MLTAFQKIYTDDKAWARVLFADTSTEPFADLIAALQVAQLKKWNNDGKTVKDVLEILELDKTIEPSTFSYFFRTNRLLA